MPGSSFSAWARAFCSFSPCSSRLRAGHVAVPEPRPAGVFVRAGRACPAGAYGTEGADLAGALQSACIAAAPDRIRGREGPDELDRAAGPALPVLLQSVVVHGSGFGSRLAGLRPGALVLAAGTGPALPDRRRGARPRRAGQGAGLSVRPQRGIRRHDAAS